jgi:lipopolysaccharide export system protein LptC
MVAVNGWKIPPVVYLFATKEQGESWKRQKHITSKRAIVLTKNQLVRSDSDMVFSLLESNPQADIIRLVILTDNLKDYQWSLKEGFFKQDEMMRLSSRNHIAYHGQIPFSAVLEIENIKMSEI